MQLPESISPHRSPSNAKNPKQEKFQKEKSRTLNIRDVQRAEEVGSLWGVKHVWGDEAQGFHVRVKALTDSMGFHGTITLIICINALVIGLETDANVKNEKVNFYTIEMGFMICYSLEIVLRLIADGLLSFRQIGFLFDVSLVVVGIVDTFILEATDGSSDLSNIMILRLLRLFKLVRVLRLFRLLRELWLLMRGILDSLSLLLWSGILLTTLIYISSVFTTQIIGGSLLKSSVWDDEEDRDSVYLWFGTLDRSMYTLFEPLVGGDLMEKSRIVMKGLPAMWLFFVLYSFFVMIAILNVIVSIIVENTMKKTLSEAEQERREMQRADRELLQRSLVALFTSADSSHDGNLSRQEWIKAVNDPSILETIRIIGLSKDQFIPFFDLLDINDDGALDPVEFLEGVMHGISEPRVCDFMTLREQVGKMLHGVEVRIAERITEHMGEFQGNQDRRLENLELQLEKQALGMFQLQRSVDSFLKRFKDIDEVPNLELDLQMKERLGDKVARGSGDSLNRHLKCQL